MEHFRLVEYWWCEAEIEIASGADQEMLVELAIEISALDKPYEKSYRLEKWVDGKHFGAWRFFQNGREFTQDIIKAISKGNTQ